LSTIASGPAAPDPTTYGDALAVLRTRGVVADVPSAVVRHLEAGERGEIAETPKPGDAVFARVRTRIVGSNRLSVEAAAREARRPGFPPVVLAARLGGEARALARFLVAALSGCIHEASPARPPICLVAGGETPVTVRGGGRGGRNQELAVAAVEPLAALPVPA